MIQFMHITLIYLERFVFDLFHVIISLHGNTERLVAEGQPTLLSFKATWYSFYD